MPQVGWFHAQTVSRCPAWLDSASWGIGDQIKAALVTPDVVRGSRMPVVHTELVDQRRQRRRKGCGPSVNSVSTGGCQMEIRPGAIVRVVVGGVVGPEGRVALHTLRFPVGIGLNLAQSLIPLR